MTLEQQVTSLELSKRLKELGVKQESYFCWQGNDNTGWYVWTASISKRDENIYAYSVAELGEILPDEIFDENQDIAYTLTSFKSDGAILFWTVGYFSEERGGLYSEEAATEADARAGLLIYLLENKLI